MIFTDKAGNPTSVKRRLFDTRADTIGDLPCIGLMPEAPWGRAIRGRGHLLGWLTFITVDPDQFGADREAVQQALEDEDTESRSLWKPMHQQPVFQDCEVTLSQPLLTREGGSVAEALFWGGLCVCRRARA